MSKTQEETREETLEKLVRRFMGLVNHMPPVVSAMALADAELPASAKGDPPKAMEEGYKRLAALMRAAYRATGEKEEEP